MDTFIACEREGMITGPASWKVLQKCYLIPWPYSPVGNLYNTTVSLRNRKATVSTLNVILETDIRLGSIGD